MDRIIANTQPEAGSAGGPANSAELAVPSVGVPDVAQPTTRSVPSGTARLSSFLARLQAATQWNRKTWIAVWVVLAAGLAVLIVKLPSKKVPAVSNAQMQMASMTAALSVQAAPKPTDAPQPARAPAQPASPSTNGSTQQAAPAEAVAESPPAQDALPEDLMRRGLGFLTVHSADPKASVYVMFRRYGTVEEKLMIPCGRRFIGIGLPARDRKEPTWLAPGKMTDIPCGGLLEVTLNPRRLR